MKKVKELFGVDSMHLEPRQGTRKQARDYCMKEESRWANPIQFGEWREDTQQGARTDFKKARALIITKRKRDDLYLDPELDPIMTKYPRWAEKLQSLSKKPVEVNIELRPWQTDVIALLDGEPVHRRIIWIWSKQSNTGKTTFGTYLSTKYDVLPCGTKLWDTLAAYDDQHILWFDLTRSESTRDWTPYSQLERLSNHAFQLSTKGTPVVRKYIKSHVMVTANIAPDERRLPQRFHVINLDDIPAPLTAHTPGERSEPEPSAGEEALHRLIYSRVPDE
jgi:hypothetical protein